MADIKFTSKEHENFYKKMLQKSGEEVKEPTCACNAPVENAKEESCCCGGQATDTETQSCDQLDIGEKLQSIKVLGAGCKSCHEMYENTKAALQTIGIDIEVDYITDMEKVMGYGIMSMPGLVVNEKVVSMGKVLKPADVEKLLHK